MDLEVDMSIDEIKNVINFVETEIELTEDIEYFLLKAKSAIDLAIEKKNAGLCLSALRQADISIRSHQVYLNSKNESLSS